MKKLLSILGAAGLTAMTGATVVACGPSDTVIKFTDAQKEILQTVLLKDGVKKDEHYKPIEDREDLKDFVQKDWTYKDFFKMEKDPKVEVSVLDLFYNGIREEMTKMENEGEKVYTPEAIEDFLQDVLKWTQKNVTLGYIGLEQKEFTPISEKNAGDKTLKTIFFDSIKADKGFDEAPTDDELEKNDGGFWNKEEHEKLTLAIQFNFENDPMYWSFTFKE